MRAPARPAGSAADPPETCPVCGRANECDLEHGRSNCWCFGEAVRGDVVAWLSAQGADGACLCPTCATEGGRSPCIGECFLDEVTRRCTGCRRTRDEIAAWPTLAPLERARIVRRLHLESPPAKEAE